MRRSIVAVVATRFLVLLVFAFATPVFLVNCASEEEKPLQEAEDDAGLEEFEQLQPQPETRSERSEYVVSVTQVLECQVNEATASMTEQEADTYLAEVFEEARTREDAAAQDVFAEHGYDCGWEELQASLGKELESMRSTTKVPFRH